MRSMGHWGPPSHRWARSPRHKESCGGTLTVQAHSRSWVIRLLQARHQYWRQPRPSPGLGQHLPPVPSGPNQPTHLRIWASPDLWCSLGTADLPALFSPDGPSVPGGGRTDCSPVLPSAWVQPQGARTFPCFRATGPRGRTEKAANLGPAWPPSSPSSLSGG